MPMMTAEELMSFVAEVFPQAMEMGFRIDALAEDSIVLALDADHQHLRPGGTISGPTMMTMADTAMWLATLAAIGPVALAVTTSLNMNFLRRPKPGTLLADARLLKLGNRLSMGEVYLRIAGDEAVVAHATVTYSIPPPDKR